MDYALHDPLEMPDGPMYKNQANLPKLPVPKLEDTLKRYLEYLEPLLSPEAFSITKEITKIFGEEGGIGEKLQEKLLDVAAKAKTSWLKPWWDEWYILDRSPCFTNVNYTLVPDFKREAFKPMDKFERASSMIHAMLAMKEEIDKSELKPDCLGKIPLDMSQYTYVFSSCRAPGKERDVILNYDQAMIRHVVVMMGNQVYKLDVVREDGKWLTLAELKASFESIVSHHSNDENEQPPINLFTSSGRSVWAENYSELMDLGNKMTLDTISSALLVINFDDYLAETWDELSQIALLEYKNRWFDKNINLIIFNDGKIAFNCEHSAMDGTATLTMLGHFRDTLEGLKLSESDFQKPEGFVPQIEKLKFKSNEKINQAAVEAGLEGEKLSKSVEDTVLIFNEYGREAIKSFKCAPDAFCQMIMQCAYRKMYGHFVSTYESVMTRAYAFGRTEVMRNPTTEAAVLAEKYCNGKATKDDIWKACESHVARVKSCKFGQGVDRHLLGLWKIAYDEKLDIEFFKDPSYPLLTQTVLSTSSLSVPGLKYAGFGPVHKDGLGVMYFPDREEIIMNITSFKGDEAKRYKKTVVETLLEFKSILTKE